MYDIKVVREAMQKALALVGKEFDMEIKVGNITYDENTFTAKVNGSSIKEDGTVVSKYSQDFKLYCPEKADWLGKMIIMNGEPVKLIGYNSKARKYYIIGEKNGKQYGFTMVSFRMAKLM